MIIQLSFTEKNYSLDLNKALDISLPIRQGINNNPSCYWAEPVKFETISSGDFIGSVQAGGNLNYQKLTISPHGNGTHTECYGHISADETATIHQSLKHFHFFAEVISVAPEKTGIDDSVIMLSQIQERIKYPGIEAIVIRTLPNTDTKKTKQYSGSNPPYLEVAVIEYLVSRGVNHVLVDLPSIDREVDDGKLSGHHAFWKFPNDTRKQCTITELIYVNNLIPDGLYLLNLQITSLEMDASPSKPVLYKLEEVL